jgi:hypothetical protein
MRNVSIHITHHTPLLRVLVTHAQGQWYTQCGGDVGRAVRCFERALALDPGQVGAWVGHFEMFSVLVGV